MFYHFHLLPTTITPTLSNKIMLPTKRFNPVLSTLALLVVISLLISTSHAVEETDTNAEQNNSNQCERLPTSLTYKQDAAPADVSGILRVVVDKINRDVTGVVDVEVKWSGTLLQLYIYI